ncbi:MAG: PASTA domain-containing protein, partial [Actinomycetota bacterium]
PQTGAGRVPFQVKAVSREDPGVMAMVQGALQVGAYHDLSIEMVPHTSRHRRSAEHELSLQNRGNVAVNAVLDASDPNDRLTFAIDPSPLRAVPGSHAAARVRVQARKWRWLGFPETHSFEVTAAPDGPAPLKAGGQFIQEALIPRWVPRVAMAAIPLLAALLAFFLLTSTVPQVDDLTQVAATGQIREAGFEVREIGEASDTVPAGKVIRTDPEGGERKRKNTTVKAFLSLGKNPVSIPNVIGLAAPIANGQLIALGLVVQQVPEPNETIPKGTVFATDPPANTRVAEGSAVKLNVSSGPPPPPAGGGGPPPPPAGGGGSQEVKVPNCTGLATAECEDRLEELGLVAQEVKEASQDVAAGRVIGTDPPGGQGAKKGSTVKVRVSSGPGAAPAPDIKASPTGLLFGNQRLGTKSAPKTVTLRNRGSAPGTIESVTPLGPHAADFSIASNTCATIAPQGECSFSVTFGPRATGTRIAQVAVKPSGGGRVTNVGVAGTGINTPPRQLSPEDGATFKEVPRTITLAWEGVEGATSYFVEVQSCPNPSCTDANASPLRKEKVTATKFTFQFVGAQPGRWRVWAVVGSGPGSVESEKSPWWGFKFTA